MPSTPPTRSLIAHQLQLHISQLCLIILRESLVLIDDHGSRHCPLVKRDATHDDPPNLYRTVSCRGASGLLGTPIQFIVIHCAPTQVNFRSIIRVLDSKPRRTKPERLLPQTCCPARKVDCSCPPRPPMTRCTILPVSRTFLEHVAPRQAVRTPGWGEETLDISFHFQFFRLASTTTHDYVLTQQQYQSTAQQCRIQTATATTTAAAAGKGVCRTGSRLGHQKLYSTTGPVRQAENDQDRYHQTLACRLSTHQTPIIS